MTSCNFKRINVVSVIFLSVEALNLANQLCQYGYLFPITDSKVLVVKDDSSLYRFQVRFNSIMYIDKQIGAARQLKLHTSKYFTWVEHTRMTFCLDTTTHQSSGLYII